MVTGAAKSIPSVVRDVVKASWLRTKYRRYTMIPPAAYVENLLLVSHVLRRPELREGVIVECGTWKGGMAAGLIEMAGDRRFLFFDSFDGLPPAREIDGERAVAWQRGDSAAGFYDNCSASLQDFEAAIALTGLSRNRIEVHKGFFEHTLPGLSVPPIAVLRLDGDWYDSTMICLRTLWDAVLPRGLILIDDYYSWDGCCRAVHDFLSERKAPERLRQGRVGRVSYILKES